MDGCIFDLVDILQLFICSNKLLKGLLDDNLFKIRFHVFVTLNLSPSSSLFFFLQRVHLIFIYIKLGLNIFKLSGLSLYTYMFVCLYVRSSLTYKPLNRFAEYFDLESRECSYYGFKFLSWVTFFSENLFSRQSRTTQLVSWYIN